MATALREPPSQLPLKARGYSFLTCGKRARSPPPTGTGELGAGLGLPAGTHDPSGVLARNPPALRGGLDPRGRGLGARGGGRPSAVARGGCEDTLTVATRGKRARSPSPMVTGGVGAGPGGTIRPAGSPDPSGPRARTPPALRRGLDRGGRGQGTGGGGLSAAAARGGCVDKRPAAQETTSAGGAD